MVATFNILGFDQLKIMSVQQEKQINLNGNDLIVLRNIVDMIEGRRLETKDIDNKSYTWIKYSLLVENLIFVSDKEDTFKKINFIKDFREIQGLRLEAQEKLNKARPENVGQASRISGVSPADISVLIIYLSKTENEKHDIERIT